MPFAHVHLRSGRTAEQKKAILDGLHAALVETFRIPEDDRAPLRVTAGPSRAPASAGIRERPGTSPWAPGSRLRPSRP